MKKAELKEFIKSRIRETLYAGMSSLSAAKKDPDYSKITDKAKIDATLRSGGSVELEETKPNKAKIKEALLDEARAYTVAADFREKAQDVRTGGPINPARLAAVLDFIDGKETVTGPQIATGVGFPGKLPRVYPILAALISVGALEMPGAAEQPETPAVNADDEEYRFRDTAEDEPEIGATEKITVDMDPTTQTATVFVVDNSDLISSVINSYKDSKARIKMNEVDDLDPSKFNRAALRSKEQSVGRLDKKIDQLVSKIAEFSPEVQAKILEILDFKFKSVDASGLTKVVANKLGKEAPSVDVEFDEEEISEDVEDISDPENATVDKMYDQVYERMNKLVNYKG